MTTPTIPTPAVSGRSGSTERPANAAPPRQTANARTAAMSAVQSAVQTMFQKAIATSATSDVVWVPAVSALLVLAVGALSLATKRPWLFAALGPTAVMLAANPGHPTTRFHAIVLGHVIAILSAWVALLLLGAGDAPTLFASGGISVARVWAGAAAIALMTAVQPSLRAYHPPAAATVLLITLGLNKLTWPNAFAMLGGVLLVAVLGEWFQRVRLNQQDQQGSAAA